MRDFVFEIDHNLFIREFARLNEEVKMPKKSRKRAVPKKTAEPIVADVIISSGKPSRATVAKKKVIPAVKSAPRSRMPLAVVGFILNLFLPGLGSIVGGKVKTGIWQVIVFLIGALLYMFVEPLGGVISFAAWVWAIVTGVVMISEAR